MTAATVDEYLAALPGDVAAIVERVLGALLRERQDVR
jgi:hypothetical protein